MKIPRIVTIVLSIFVATSIIYLIGTEVRKPGKNETSKAGLSQRIAQGEKDNPASVQNHVLTVYYFHTTARCPTCRRIEALTESTVKRSFPSELAEKRIIWMPVNIDLPENRHFADDYKLFTKSVVIVDSAEGRQIRWKNLDKIWELVRDEPSFTGYIKKEIEGYLKTI